MATATYSALIEKLSGKVGNGVFSNWKGRGVLRCLSSSVSNPRTVRQQNNRSWISFLSTAWVQTLSADERALWEEYAQKLSVNARGALPIGTPGLAPLYGNLQSGRNAFIAVNMALNNSYFSDPFNPVLVPPVSVVTPTLSECSLTGADAELQLEFTLAHPLDYDLQIQIFTWLYIQGGQTYNVLNQDWLFTSPAVGPIFSTWDDVVLGHGKYIHTVSMPEVTPFFMDVQVRGISALGHLFVLSPVTSVLIPPVAP